MRYTNERIEALAAAAKLDLSKEEWETVRADLERMLRTADALCDEEETPDAEAAIGLSSLREDETEPSLDAELVLSLAPEREDAFVVVPRTVEG